MRNAYIEANGALPRAIWENLDDSRSLQYTNSVKFPQGLAHRFFESWISWDVRTSTDGLKEYVIAIAPIEEYTGTHYNLKGTERMVRGLSRGLHVVKELTENTCEWSRVLMVDIKIALPKAILDMLSRSNLVWANQLQEEFKRNGNMVDRERRLSLATTMKRRRGIQLTKEQQVRRR